MCECVTKSYVTSDELTQFINCRLIRDHQIITEDLWIRNGKIIDPEPVFFDEQQLAQKRINCKNAIIAPGFIDIQINGGFGIDFSYERGTVKEDLNKVAAKLIESGVTSFCPTIVTSPPEVYRKILPNMPKQTLGASNLGMHLEGPFINVQKKGAHPLECIKEIENIDTIRATYGSLENVKIITLAPEVANSEEIIPELTKMGITVSLGHSMADFNQGETAVRNGARLITHLFNAMLPFHHRDPGLVGLLTSDAIPPGETLYFGIIADGIHSHPAAMRIAQRTHPNGLILVTDAISAMGLGEGEHHLGQLKVEIKQGRAYVAGTSTLCGSIAPMDNCVRVFREATNCSTAYAIDAATMHPAKCLKVDKNKGTLDFNTDADFIMLDDDLNVLSTWIAGNCVYKRPKK